MTNNSDYSAIAEIIQHHATANDGPGPVMNAAIISQRIQHDQDQNAGQYRRVKRLLCPHCGEAKGSKPSVVATTYVGPGGQHYVDFPARRIVIRDDGTEPMNKPRQAKRLEESANTVTRCKRCLRHYFTAHRVEKTSNGETIHLDFLPIIETIFGKETEGGVTIFHKVPKTMLVERSTK